MKQIIQSLPYPVYTTVERDALTNVLTGFTITNSDVDATQTYNGSNWLSEYNDIFIPTTEQELVNNATTLGVINFYDKYYAKSISCPNLVQCNLIDIYQARYYTGKIESLNLSVLESVGEMYCSFTNIESIDLSCLVSAIRIQLISNTLLTSVVISDSLNCLGMSFSSCALSQSCVDDILAKIDTAGYNGGSLILNNGANSAPSAAGLVSKSNLQGKGWSVYVNS